MSGEREAASRHSASIEFLRAEKVLAQLSAESQEQGTTSQEPSTGSPEQGTGHGGLTEAEIIEMALAAKKVFMHRRI